MIETETTRKPPRPTLQIDGDEVRYAATISVWVRWFILGAAVVEVAYRTPEHAAAFAALVATLAALNVWLHYRVIANRRVTLNLLLGMAAVDLIVITLAVTVHEGFESFIFLAYYPAIGSLALVGSATLAIGGTTVVAIIYVTVCLTLGSGLDLDFQQEKELFWRIVVMYGTVASFTLVTRFERIRRRDAVERERTLQRERVEFSHTVHDTTAQIAYIIGLGLDTAIEQAGDSNAELSGTLEATSALAKSATWEIRRPLDMSNIFEGRSLSSVLRSRVATFTQITSVPAELAQSGDEPPLAIDTRVRLFSIVHNALANAFRHADASTVKVALDYEADRVRLSVSDDGVGLPEDYAERGRGFGSMKEDAEGMGGTLTVETGKRAGGTIVTCVVPMTNLA